jgi:uncharacterized protein
VGQRSDPLTGAATKEVVANLALMASGATGSSEGEPGHAPPARPASGSGRRALNRGTVSEAGDVSTELPPRSGRDAGAWLVLAGLGFIAGQVASTILLVGAAAATGHLSDVSKLAMRSVPPAWVVVSELVGLWIGFVGAAVLASRFRGTGSLRRDLGLEVRGWDVVIGPLVGLGGQILLLPLLYLPLEHVVPRLDQRLKAPAQHLTGGFPGADLVLISVLTVVVVPVVEELFFRGLVLRGLLRMCRGAGPVLGVGLAVVADGAIFGLAHFELLQLLGLAVFGAVLALMTVRFRRLGPAIFAHGTFNLLAILSVVGVLH